MSALTRLGEEVRSVLLTTLYFAVWFVALVTLKGFVLAEYQIDFDGLSMALIGALVVAKVVLVMEHVSLGAWVRRRAAWVDVVLRTGLYICGVFVVLVCEKAFEMRHEQGGFGPSLIHLFAHANMDHVWASTICVGWALLVFNALTVLRRRLGARELLGFFSSSLPHESKP